MSLRFDGESKSFIDKQKPKELSNTSFTRNVKGISLSEKEKATTRNIKIMKEKKISLGRQIYSKVSKSTTCKDTRKVKRQKQ